MIEEHWCKYNKVTKNIVANMANETISQENAFQTVTPVGPLATISPDDLESHLAQDLELDDVTVAEMILL